MAFTEVLSVLLTILVKTERTNMFFTMTLYPETNFKRNKYCFDIIFR